MILIFNYLFEMLFGLRWLHPIDDEMIDRGVYRDKVKYCRIAGILLILISGLRHVSVGADTYEYYRSYIQVSSTSWQGVLLAIFQRYRDGIMTIRDPGYSVFVKITQIISVNFQLYLIIVACIFMIPFVKWIIRESSSPVISFCLYSSLFFYFFSITGIRQTVATALTVLIGDEFVKRRKLLPFLAITLVSSTIHRSALVFLPFYFLSRIPVKKIPSWVSIVLIVVSFVFRSPLKSFFIEASGYTDYISDYEGAATYTFTFLILSIYLLSIISMKRDKKILDNNRFYIALYLAIFFTPLTWLNPSAMRVVQYFSIYLVLLIPEIIDSVFDLKNQFIARLSVIVVLFILFVRGDLSYLFFWQT